MLLMIKLWREKREGKVENKNKTNLTLDMIEMRNYYISINNKHQDNINI